MTKQNLHIHTTYCDGKDTPEEMILTAIERGYDSIGFSGHSYMFFSPGHSMSLENTPEYIADVRRCAAKYADRIRVFCGLEVEMYSEVELTGYDYLIGSVHYLRIGSETIGFDRGQDEVARVIGTYFSGDGMAYAKMYYESMTHLPEHGDFDIIGHFDLITKHAENVRFFDTESPLYHRWATEAAEALVGKIPLFEVNTGAISRGYRTTPYPSIPILKELHRLGYGAVITSDCHDRRSIDCYYNESVELLKACGFREIWTLDAPGQWRSEPLD